MINPSGRPLCDLAGGSDGKYWQLAYQWVQKNHNSRDDEKVWMTTTIEKEAVPTAAKTT